MIDFIVEPIKDFYTRENFQKLLEVFGQNPFLSGSFRVFNSSPKRTDTSHKINHGLSFTPTDVFITYISNDATVVPVFSDITRELLSFNVSKACSFRCVAGRFR